MTQFLDKFKGRSNRLGKDGLIQLLDQNFRPIKIGQELSPSKSINYINRTKSIDMDKVNGRVERIELPPIKPNLYDKLNFDNITQSGKNIISGRKSEGQRIKQPVSEKDQEDIEQIKLSPLKKKKKSLICIAKQGYKMNPFDNVPDEHQSYRIPKDEMRFLKSFERYTNSKHFTIHRKMSQKQCHNQGQINF